MNYLPTMSIIATAMLSLGHRRTGDQPFDFKSSCTIGKPDDETLPGAASEANTTTTTSVGDPPASTVVQTEPGDDKSQQQEAGIVSDGQSEGAVVKPDGDPVGNSEPQHG